jgi:hypothetical protein
MGVMTSKKQVVERRKHKRFHVQDGTFAVLGPRYGKIGPIINMSMSGLAFSYVAGDEQGDSSYQLSILLAADSFHLTRIPFKTVWDTEAEEVPFSTLAMRQCGVEFGNLTERQISQMEYFVEEHTVGGA